MRHALDDIDINFIKSEIDAFLSSKKRHDMQTGRDYYAGRHDILRRHRTAIGEGGRVQPVYNLPDNRAVDNRFRKAVDQKTGYILGKPVDFRCDDKIFGQHLRKLNGGREHRLFKNLAKTAYVEGIAWLFAGYDEGGEFSLRQLPSREVIPGWRDATHTELDYVIRVYDTDVAGGEAVTSVEVFCKSGVYFYDYSEGELTPQHPYHAPHVTHDGEAFSYTRLPFIPFCANSDETPVITSVKSLQDGLNAILSNFWNVMEEDPRNSILVLVNYDGENLGEFRRNLAAYGAVKVRTVDGAPGDLKTMSVPVNCENYRALIDIFKKAITENALAYDGRGDRADGNSPNRLNIASMYSDIDISANEAETEFSAAFERLVSFYKAFLFNTRGEDFAGVDVRFIFNRDMLINESAVIDDCVKSLAVLPREVVAANHPWG